MQALRWITAEARRYTPQADHHNLSDTHPKLRTCLALREMTAIPRPAKRGQDSERAQSPVGLTGISLPEVLWFLAGALRGESEP
jgi:hypothetical protein